MDHDNHHADAQIVRKMKELQLRDHTIFYRSTLSEQKERKLWGIQLWPMGHQQKLMFSSEFLWKKEKKMERLRLGTIHQMWPLYESCYGQK